MDNKKHFVFMKECNLIFEVISEDVGKQIAEKDNNFGYNSVEGPAIGSFAEFEKKMNDMIEEQNKRWEMKKFQECDLYKVEIVWKDNKQHYMNVLLRNDNIPSFFDIIFKEKISNIMCSDLNIETSDLFQKIEEVFQIKSVELVAGPGEKHPEEVINWE